MPFTVGQLAEASRRPCARCTTGDEIGLLPLAERSAAGHRHAQDVRG